VIESALRLAVGRQSRRRSSPLVEAWDVEDPSSFKPLRSNTELVVR
jgi:hypothetical protein